MRFDYKRYRHPEERAILRPVIPVVLRNPRTAHFPAVAHEALVDSGSDRCIFSAEIGELLGFDIKAGKELRVGGVVAGESRPMYLHVVAIEVGGIGGVSFTAPVAFMPDLSNNGHGLLGRDGFFDQFSYVKFRDADNELLLGKHQQH
jgi:hypothetical protein